MIYFGRHRCPDTHCITKTKKQTNRKQREHLLCVFFFFEFVTCVSVIYVSLTTLKGFFQRGGGQCLPDFKCFHGVLYLSV